MKNLALIWILWLLVIPILLLVVSYTGVFTEPNAGSQNDNVDEQAARAALRAVSLVVFGIIAVALIFAIQSARSKFPKDNPQKQFNRLRHLRTLAGSQALIGAALVATILQFEQDWIAQQLLIGTLIWVVSSLWYFIAQHYQLKIEG